MNSFEAMYHEPTSGGSVRCVLCPHFCVIPENSKGKCGARKNNDGKLYAESYACLSGIALDPIEKKPLHFFYPGSMILSVGTYGCNLDCPFCQNHQSVRQYIEPSNDIVMPADLTAIAKKNTAHGNIGVAYTYNEPLVGYEYVYECAKLIRNAGQINVLVTNGYINPEPLKKLLSLVDAMNIDLKGFTQNFYDKLGGKLEHVKEAIVLASKNCHVEITILVIPGENEFDIEEAAKWLAGINPEIPLHLSRFFPRYRYLNHEPTPIETLKEAARISKKYLKNVILGNIR